MKKHLHYLLIAFLLLAPAGRAGEKALPWEERKAREELHQKVREWTSQSKKQEQRNSQQKNKAAFVAGVAVAEASNRGWFRKAWLWIIGAAGAIWALLRGKKGSKNRRKS